MCEQCGHSDISLGLRGREVPELFNAHQSRNSASEPGPCKRSALLKLNGKCISTAPRGRKLNFAKHLRNNASS